METSAGKMSQSSPQPHNYLSAGLIVLGLVTFIITAAINGLGGSGAGVPQVFYATVGDISDKYQLYITPSGSTFAIWSIIYLWLAVSLVMFTVTIFLTNSRGRVYLSPAIASPAVMATFSVNMVFNVAWIFIWDRAFIDENMAIVASIFLFLIAITNILVMVFMARNISHHAEEFAYKAPLFWWGVAYRIVLNGLGIYTTWTVIASLINLTTALVYPGGLDQTNCCIASLSLLVIFHVTWFILENFVFDKYARYILTPYLVVIWASYGIRSKKNDDPMVPQEIKDYVLAILIIATLTLLVRAAIVIYRVIRKPLIKMSTVSSFNSSM